MGNSPLTVSTLWLKEQLEDEKKELVVLDVSYYKDRDAKEDYLKEHIPGAVFFDIMNKVEPTEYLPNNIPDKDAFQEYCRSRGLNKDSRIVVYDNEGKGGFYLGARAWWMFKLFGHDKVCVLDGGLQKWIADGNVTSEEEPELKEGNFKVDMAEDDWLVKYEDMIKNIGNVKAPQVCDGRPPAIYDGNSANKRTGHYPGAKNVPFMNFLRDGTCLKSEDQIKDVFKAAGVDLSEKIIAMGSAGMGICTLVLAAKVCGAKHVKLYLGGATEWLKRADEHNIEQTTDEPEQKPAEEPEQKPVENGETQKPVENGEQKPVENGESEKPVENGETQQTVNGTSEEQDVTQQTTE